MTKIGVGALALALWATPSFAQQADDQKAWVTACEDWDDWDKPGPPFKIYGSTYYVGTCGISSILVTSSEGHILIDGGTEKGADLIAANIVALGFNLSDVKILLMSHEHHDHVGGIARLKQLTGARLLTSVEAKPVMESGIASPNDPQAGMHDPFSAAKVDGVVIPGNPVELGGNRLYPLETPGHTLGALSWEWSQCEVDVCAGYIYADSLSPISNDTYRFSDHPDLLDSYRAGLATIASSNFCSILLTPHPSASGMRDWLLEKAPRRKPYTRCAKYALDVGERLGKRLAEEAAAAQ